MGVHTQGYMIGSLVGRRRSSWFVQNGLKVAACILSFLGGAYLAPHFSSTVSHSSSTSSSTDSTRAPPHHGPDKAAGASSGTVLILARTFHGHAGRDERVGPGSHLNMFIDSLNSLDNQNWEVWFVNTDSKSLGPKFVEQVREYRDERLHFYGTESFIAGRRYDNWYSAYDVVDAAVRKIAGSAPPDKYEWIMFTNADNVYLPAALDFLDSRYDMIGFNLFQRAHPGALGDSATQNRCMLNGMQYAATDLGSNVISLSKYLEFDYKFFDFVVNDDPYPEGATITPDAGVDGRMIGVLRQSGMRLLHVDRCLFSHAPNPWMCKQQGGIWNNHPTRSKAKCITQTEANTLQADVNAYSGARIVLQPFDLPDYLSWDPLSREMMEESWAYERELSRILVSKNIIDAQHRPLKNKLCPSLLPAIKKGLVECDKRYQQLHTMGYRFDTQNYLDRNLDLNVLGNPPTSQVLDAHFRQTLEGGQEFRCHQWHGPGNSVVISPWCATTVADAPLPEFILVDQKKPS